MIISTSSQRDRPPVVTMWTALTPHGTVCFIYAIVRLLFPFDRCLEQTPLDPCDLYRTRYSTGPSPNFFAPR